MIGAGGDDNINGGDGDDRIFKNGDEDDLIGGDGADFIYGQSGDDVASGGAGADIFQFRSVDGADIVSDFTVNEDTFLAFGFGFASGADVFALAR